MAFLNDILHGEGVDIINEDHAKRIEHLQPLAMEYNPVMAYNKDETGIFHKCLQNRGYLELDKK